MSHSTSRSVNRRRFLKTSAAAASALTFASGVHAGGDGVLRVGLVGCGGRGTGAASQALRADREVRLVALADAFEDRAESCYNQLRSDAAIRDKVDVPRERRYAGFDAYQHVIEQSDVVLLCTPPGFRPIHLEAAVRANKHVFCEKPMAVDAPGVRRVIAAAQDARRRNISLVSGFCWRYHPGMRATFQRIHDNAVGDMTKIAGQKPVITKARKAIAGFKIREGYPIGAMVTLRHDRMYEFLDRLISVAIPRIRDFRGVSSRSFDGRGNYSLGIKEQIIFPEIDYDQVDTIRGLDICITTSARNDEAGKALLEEFNFPLRQP